MHSLASHPPRGPSSRPGSVGGALPSWPARRCAFLCSPPAKGPPQPCHWRRLHPKERCDSVTHVPSRSPEHQALKNRLQHASLPPGGLRQDPSCSSTFHLLPETPLSYEITCVPSDIIQHLVLLKNFGQGTHRHYKEDGDEVAIDPLNDSLLINLLLSFQQWIPFRYPGCQCARSDKVYSSSRAAFLLQRFFCSTAGRPPRTPFGRGVVRHDALLRKTMLPAAGSITLLCNTL